MLGRTHGQPASPTTLGKEFYVYAERLRKEIGKLNRVKLEAKLNGATGNFNALHVAYPEIDWIEFSNKFISYLNLEPNLVTTQIMPIESYIEIFDILKRINNILIGFDQDVWRYISDGWFNLKVNDLEVGSSTMPHKINPINFENSEGILGIANSLLEHFCRKLPISRLQRDLSDSVVKRFIGEALGCSLIGYKGIITGIDKLGIDKDKINLELNSHPEIIAEGIQTVLRKEGYIMPYENLKNLTRGKRVTLNDLYQFIDSLDIPLELNLRLKQIMPENYFGLADKIIG